MSKILRSIDGKKCGLDHAGNLLIEKGFVSGLQGNQIAAPAPSTIAFFDDFNHGLETTTWLATEGTDAATSAAAILAGGIGGVLRLTTGDAGTGLAADTEQITHTALQWQASNGGLVFQTRFKLSAITTCFVFVGLTDTVAGALEAPIESAASANTITTNASDAVGFMFDTRMTDDKWWLVGVKGNTDATAQNSGLAPVADTYATFRIEVTAAGNANFFYNGAQVGSTLVDAITAATDLAPVLTVSKTSVAASMTMDVDYVHVAMNRAQDGSSV
jgi:hypothetical protein